MPQSSLPGRGATLFWDTALRATAEFSIAPMKRRSFLEGQPSRI
jgi:hypothetical protein